MDKRGKWEAGKENSDFKFNFNFKCKALDRNFTRLNFSDLPDPVG